MSFYFYNIYDGDPLHTLSTRISNSASPPADITSAHNPEVLANNIKYKITRLIAEIIFAARWVEPTTDDFNSALKSYNDQHGTTLTQEDFIVKGIIRLVNGYILFPSVIGSILSRITSDKEQGKQVEIPGKDFHEVSVMKIFYDKFSSPRRRPVISKAVLQNILQEHRESSVDIRFLESADIIQSLEEEYVVTKRNVYHECFFSEISFLLWDRFGETATEKDFSRYISLLHKFDLYDFHDLWKFLQGSSLNRLCELAIAFINSEPDLQDQSAEVKKVYLDQNHFNHFGFNIPDVPPAEFEADDPYELLAERDRLDFYHRDLFDYQGTRTLYRLVLRLIIQLQTNYREPYADVLKLLKQCDKPFVVYELRYEIQRNYPGIIPYLLNDDELAPVGMNMIDELKKSFQWIGRNLHVNEVASLRAREIESFWQAGFVHLLDRYSKRLSFDPERAASVLSRIFLDQTKRVFIFHNTETDYNHPVNLGQKKRYDQMMDQFGLRRLDSSGYYTSGGYVPMLIDSLLPPLLVMLRKGDNHIQPNEFLKFEASYIFLYTDLLRLLDRIDLSNNEQSITKEELAKVEVEGYTFLSGEVVRYFTQKTVTVSVYFEPADEVPVKRGINDFGLELIEWGELLLHFQSAGLLSKIDKDFHKALKFNKRIKVYDEGNNAEMVKLDYYLRILMQAFIAISKSANRFRFARLPVNDTLAWLQERIGHYATEYHSVEEKKWSVDLFNDRSKHVTHNFYRKPIFGLLCQAITFFDPNDQLLFLEKFFQVSTDLLQMLTAHNKIENKSVQEWLKRRIATINVNVFIDDGWSMNEIESALIEAINSVDFFDIAEPLLKKVEAHAEKVKRWGLENRNFIYRIRAYQAFRKADMELLNSIPEPRNDYVNEVMRMTEKNLKKYYQALNDLYNLSNYTGAIDALSSLSSQFPKNADYAFHLYRARIFKATANEPK